MSKTVKVQDAIEPILHATVHICKYSYITYKKFFFKASTLERSAHVVKSGSGGGTEGAGSGGA